jgi:RimJ/RimL family protein N-acetyltransferase
MRDLLRGQRAQPHRSQLDRQRQTVQPATDLHHRQPVVLGDAVYIGEQDYWGGGYGTDTMKVICRYGFEMMRLHGISLWVVPENTAARHVYEKVGFVEEGRKRESFRRDGKWHDTILMSLLEGELID